MLVFEVRKILSSMPFEPDNGIDSVLRDTVQHKSAFASGFYVPEMGLRKYKCRFELSLIPQPSLTCP